MKAYLLDNKSIFVGVVEIDPLAALPKCALSPPPSLKIGEIARFSGGLWEILQGYPNDPPKSMQQIILEVSSNVQQRLDDFAKTRNYDGILSACTYATSNIQKFKDEGQYCVNSRDATWAKLYEIMHEVETGVRPIPTSYQEIEPELPELIWPN